MARSIKSGGLFPLGLAMVQWLLFLSRREVDDCPLSMISFNKLEQYHYHFVSDSSLNHLAKHLAVGWVETPKVSVGSRRGRSPFWWTGLASSFPAPWRL